jgi:hypothetical protein
VRAKSVELSLKTKTPAEHKSALPIYFLPYVRNQSREKKITWLPLSAHACEEALN